MSVIEFPSTSPTGSHSESPSEPSPGSATSAGVGSTPETTVPPAAGPGSVVALPHPGRVAADVVRIILSTSSEDDPAQRKAIARSVIDMWRRNRFRGHYGAGVGGVQSRGGEWSLAAVCLTCAWVGEIGAEEEPAHAAASAHRC